MRRGGTTGVCRVAHGPRHVTGGAYPGYPAAIQQDVLRELRWNTRVWGVRDVVNNITVKIPGVGGRTDADIARAVREALEWDPPGPRGAHLDDGV
jgi:hypothetical protein